MSNKPTIDTSKWPAFTAGSRWNSQGAGVGVVENIDGDGDYVIRFSNGEKRFFHTPSDNGSFGVEENYWLTDPADPVPPAEDGWTPFVFGEYPLADDVRIDARLANGEIVSDTTARMLKPDYDADVALGAVKEYRVHRPEPQPTPPASTEQDSISGKFWFCESTQEWIAEVEIQVENELHATLRGAGKTKLDAAECIVTIDPNESTEQDRRDWVTIATAMMQAMRGDASYQGTIEETADDAGLYATALLSARDRRFNTGNK